MSRSSGELGRVGSCHVTISTATKIGREGSDRLRSAALRTGRSPSFSSTDISRPRPHTVSHVGSMPRFTLPPTTKATPSPLLEFVAAHRTIDGYRAIAPVTKPRPPMSDHGGGIAPLISRRRRGTRGEEGPRTVSEWTERTPHHGHLELVGRGFDSRSSRN